LNASPTKPAAEVIASTTPESAPSASTTTMRVLVHHAHVMSLAGIRLAHHAIGNAYANVHVWVAILLRERL
jgi:hypothetical protein